MPVTTPTRRAKLVSTTGKMYAVSQPQVTTIALLYGVEVSVPSGFSADPQLDIHVFNNPKAAFTFVKSIDPSCDEDAWKGMNLIMPDVEYIENAEGMYYVTAQRATWLGATGTLSKAPVGIPGCTYGDHPKPFIADVTPNHSLPTCGAYLTVVAVINNTSAIDKNDETAIIRIITESASK